MHKALWKFNNILGTLNSINPLIASMGLVHEYFPEGCLLIQPYLNNNEKIFFFMLDDTIQSNSDCQNNPVSSVLCEQ